MGSAELYDLAGRYLLPVAEAEASPVADLLQEFGYGPLPVPDLYPFMEKIALRKDGKYAGTCQQHYEYCPFHHILPDI